MNTKKRGVTDYWQTKANKFAIKFGTIYFYLMIGIIINCTLMKLYEKPYIVPTTIFGWISFFLILTTPILIITIIISNLRFCYLLNKKEASEEKIPKNLMNKIYLTSFFIPLIIIIIGEVLLNLK